MKRSDTGDFCVLYIEPDDEKEAIFRVVTEQKKPIVIMLTGRGQRSEVTDDGAPARVFQRPEDFVEFKHLKRHLAVPVLFVISGSESLIHLAGRHGFPVYRSMDALADAIASRQQARQHGVSRKTLPLSPLPDSTPRRTIPLRPLEDEPVVQRRTAPLLATEPVSRNGVPINENGLIAIEVPEMRDRASTRNGTLPNGQAGTYGPVEGAATNESRAERSNGRRDDISTAITDPFGQTRPAPTVAPPPPAHPGPEPKSRLNHLTAGVLILLLFAIITAGLGYFLIVSHHLPTDAPAMTNTLVGHVSFISSNQISENSNQGLDDKVLVELNDLAPPATGKSYYAWLLSDKSQSDTQSLLLGALPVNNEHAQLLYPGDQNHTNLLAAASRFLVTEEDSAPTPLTPSAARASSGRRPTMQDSCAGRRCAR